MKILRINKIFKITIKTVSLNNIFKANKICSTLIKCFI